MKRKVTVLTFSALLFALCGSVDAQQPKLAKIGLLRASSVERDAYIEMLRRELSALGYVDGKNIAFEFRAAESINLTVSLRWLTR